MSASSKTYKYNLVNENEYSWKRTEPLTEKTQELTLKLPCTDLYWDPKADTINPRIFADSLAKTPNITVLKLTELRGAEALLLRAIATVFKHAYPKNLTQLIVHTPDYRKGMGASRSREEVHQLYNALMTDFGNPQLLTATINDDTISDSPLSTELLGVFFKKSPNLQSLCFRLKDENKDLTIPFQLCPNLEQLTLAQGRGLSQATFDSLKGCKKLNTLVCDELWETRKLLAFLMTTHGLDLKVLDLDRSTMLSTDYELFMMSKQLPNLEVFSQTHFYTHQNKLTDEGLALFARNCPKLTTLRFCFENTSEEGFAAFVQRTPNLQKLETNQAYHLGENALIALAKSCPRLKTLKLVHWKELTEKGLCALAENCPDLEFLNISCCKNVSLKGIEEFVKRAPNLKAIHVWLPGEDKNEGIKKLEQAYAHLDWSESTSYHYSEKVPCGPATETSAASAGTTFSPSLLNQFLLEASRHGRLDDVLHFLELGANPKMTGRMEKGLIPAYDENPLSLAARLGHLEVVQALHKGGADLKAVEGMLGGLSQPEHLEILRYLLKAGCNPNVKGEYGVTPLQAMAAKKITGTRYLFGNTFGSVSLDCVKALVEHGADTSVRYEGQSLVDIARENGNKPVLEYFLSDLKLADSSATKPVSARSEAELVLQALTALNQTQPSLSRGSSSSASSSLSSAMDAYLEATMTLLARDMGFQRIPAVDRLVATEKNPAEKVLPKPIFDMVTGLLPQMKQKILGFVFTPELAPKRGIYYLEGEADDKLSGACYRRCMNMGDDCMKELASAKKQVVIQRTRSYDPMTQVLIATPSKRFFLVENIDGFLSGKSRVKEI